MAKMKAIKKGYDGKQIRNIGDVFDFEGKPGSWMQRVDEKAESGGPSKPEKPASKK